ncbi:hypothetical protein [Streptomyces sp. RTd22]|uniref:hypothetical protein n=1 Tax=Streptomyces sp. RTd22 TaxID=1841249 RepID=UPI0007C44B21|nr:hypothetical protein [Streptomyces sp. RTd22]
MERLVAGEDFQITSEHLGVIISEKDGVWIRGCDCSAQMPDAKVRELHEVLGAYLRRQKNKEKRNG